MYTVYTTVHADACWLGRSRVCYLRLRALSLLFHGVSDLSSVSRVPRGNRFNGLKRRQGTEWHSNVRLASRELHNAYALIASR